MCVWLWIVGVCLTPVHVHRRELPFTKTAHLSNPWNEHKPVKIGRDGQVHPPRPSILYTTVNYTDLSILDIQTYIELFYYITLSHHRIPIGIIIFCLDIRFACKYKVVILECV